LTITAAAAAMGAVGRTMATVAAAVGSSNVDGSSRGSRWEQQQQQ
jgi:hypothetical protein